MCTKNFCINLDVHNLSEIKFTVAPKKKSPEKPKAVLPSGRKDSSFFEQVYDVARLIPSGRVTSYGAIAAYRDAMYADDLMGPGTIDPLPEPALEAFIDHGEVRRTLDAGRRSSRPAGRAGPP